MRKTALKNRVFEEKPLSEMTCDEAKNTLWKELMQFSYLYGVTNDVALEVHNLYIDIFNTARKELGEKYWEQNQRDLLPPETISAAEAFRAYIHDHTPKHPA